MNTKTIDIPDSLIREWDSITTLIAEICEVPASLVMQCHDNTIAVKATSDTANNPYHHGDSEKLAGELYCETVMAQQSPLHVPDALNDPEWCDNPDIKLGMIMYYGVPINWPDGTPFGTLCILDRQKKVASSLEQKLIQHFARLIENHLALIVKNNELAQVAGQDELTGLLNRRMLHEILPKDIASTHRLGARFCLLFIDFDNFKEINDRFGHSQGDYVLKTLADIIQKHLRKGDYAYRFGGEEFIVTLLEVELAEAAEIAERLRQRLAVLADELELQDVITTASIGVTMLKAEDTVDSLLKRGDQLMYRAKHQGKNQVITELDNNADDDRATA